LWLIFNDEFSNGSLYEQRRVHHVGSLPKLEDQSAALRPILTGRPAIRPMASTLWSGPSPICSSSRWPAKAAEKLRHAGLGRRQGIEMV
jgi:hypothetical protein